jgi:hypothetical protein
MMPEGIYYIGDLCYVMDDAEWLEVCDLTIQGSRVIDGEFQLKDGRRFAMYGTAYGDGTYYDQYGHSYSVDSGSIGCIRMADIKASNTYSLGDTQAILDFLNGKVKQNDTKFSILCEKSGTTYSRVMDRARKYKIDKYINYLTAYLKIVFK